jgi:hypothetical protein
MAFLDPLGFLLPCRDVMHGQPTTRETCVHLPVHMCCRVGCSQAECVEHGWPSFRTEEVILANVVVDSNGNALSKCGTKLGSYLPDTVGPRWCIDLSCISGQPKSA